MGRGKGKGSEREEWATLGEMIGYRWGKGFERSIRAGWLCCCYLVHMMESRDSRLVLRLLSHIFDLTQLLHPNRPSDATSFTCIDSDLIADDSSLDAVEPIRQEIDSEVLGDGIPGCVARLRYDLKIR